MPATASKMPYPPVAVKGATRGCEDNMDEPNVFKAEPDWDDDCIFQEHHAGTPVGRRKVSNKSLVSDSSKSPASEAEATTIPCANSGASSSSTGCDLDDGLTMLQRQSKMSQARGFTNMLRVSLIWERDEAPCLPSLLHDVEAQEEVLTTARRRQLEEDREEAAHRAKTEREQAERMGKELTHEKQMVFWLDGLHSIYTGQPTKALQRLSKFLTKHRFADLNVNVPRRRNSDCPLHVASQAGDRDMVVLLLKRRADPRLQNFSKETPADVAAKRDRKGSHSEILVMLQTVTELWNTAQKDEVLRKYAPAPSKAFGHSQSTSALRALQEQHKI